MIPESSFICVKCKYFHTGKPCPAFPNGVPDEIMINGNKHEKPLPEQKNNIVFTPFKDE